MNSRKRQKRCISSYRLSVFAMVTPISAALASNGAHASTVDLLEKSRINSTWTYFEKWSTKTTAPTYRAVVSFPLSWAIKPGSRDSIISTLTISPGAVACLNFDGYAFVRQALRVCLPNLHAGHIGWLIFARWCGTSRSFAMILSLRKEQWFNR